MAETTGLNLSGVPETLLITLYIRALETQRPDALLKDEQAVALVQKMGYDFARVKQIKMDEDDKTAIILRTLQFDRATREFLARHPRSIVVHIGCGLNARFERVDKGEVEWYDLDVPEVIDLRRRWMGGDKTRYHLLGCSAFDPAWMEMLSADRPFLFLAEGVFMYFTEAQVKSLVLRLEKHFPGAELVFDTFSPYMVRMNNLRFRLSKFGSLYHWGLKRGRDLELWSKGVRLLDQWFPFDSQEPRLAHIAWLRHIPFLAHVMGIFHYRLGNHMK